MRRKITLALALSLSFIFNGCSLYSSYYNHNQGDVSGVSENNTENTINETIDNTKSSVEVIHGDRNSSNIKEYEVSEDSKRRAKEILEESFKNFQDTKYYTICCSITSSSYDESVDTSGLSDDNHVNINHTQITDNCSVISKWESDGYRAHRLAVTQDAADTLKQVADSWLDNSTKQIYTFEKYIDSDGNEVDYNISKDSLEMNVGYYKDIVFATDLVLTQSMICNGEHKLSEDDEYYIIETDVDDTESVWYGNNNNAASESVHCSLRILVTKDGMLPDTIEIKQYSYKIHNIANIDKFNSSYISPFGVFDESKKGGDDDFESNTSEPSDMQSVITADEALIAYEYNVISDDDLIVPDEIREYTYDNNDTTENIMETWSV